MPLAYTVQISRVRKRFAICVGNVSLMLRVPVAKRLMEENPNQKKNAAGTLPSEQ